MEILGTILIGAVAGWLGGMVFKGSGLGLLWNVIFGILGGFVGYWLFGKFNISLGEGWIGAILTGAIGALLILLVLNLLFRKSK